jgi:hypothetical protein
VVIKKLIRSSEVYDFEKVKDQKLNVKKRQWASPEIFRYGDVREITRGPSEEGCPDNQGSGAGPENSAGACN